MARIAHNLEDSTGYEFDQQNREARDCVQAVRRNDIPSLHSVTIKDKTHYLGILKDFHKHPTLDDFVPKTGRLSVSWVHLGKNEMLDPHVHPIKSMIIICKGQAESLGELSTSLYEGDIFLVPPGCEHGFIGSGENGFWGLSVQFEERGLYEDPSTPLARFIENPNNIRKVPNDNERTNLSSLLKINERERNNFSKNPIFAFLHENVQDNIELRDKFLDYFQVWSDAFQKMVLAREVFCDDPIFHKVSKQHLEEEFGHNNELANERNNLIAEWDPILHAIVSWFPWKILNIDEHEKVVLVHLVVECVATVFYTQIPSFIGESLNSAHFENHRKLDVEHEKMGLNLLENLSPDQYLRLGKIQKEGWEMCNQLFQRIYDLLQ